MPADRRAVLLRFPPELLERVDEARGGVGRTSFLIAAIEAHLDEVERPAVHGANFGFIDPTRLGVRAGEA